MGAGAAGVPSLATAQPRPAGPAGEALELVERQVLAIAAQRERPRASGQHVKRGLLLYGPPGNGKTLTVRYIVSKAQEHTVLVQTGGALDLMRPAGALARMLEPVLVVLEDVDLVSEDRGDVRPRQEPGAVRSVEPDGWEGRGRRCCVPDTAKWTSSSLLLLSRRPALPLFHPCAPFTRHRGWPREPAGRTGVGTGQRV